MTVPESLYQHFVGCCQLSDVYLIHATFRELDILLSPSLSRLWMYNVSVNSKLPEDAVKSSSETLCMPNVPETMCMSHEIFVVLCFRRRKLDHTHTFHQY